MSSPAGPSRTKARKRRKTREELESQVRLSLPDVLQWFGWPRRTWDKTWKPIFPAHRWVHNGHKFWATADVLAWEAEHEVKPSRSMRAAASTRIPVDGLSVEKGGR